MIDRAIFYIDGFSLYYGLNSQNRGLRRHPGLMWGQNDVSPYVWTIPGVQKLSRMRRIFMIVSLLSLIALSAHSPAMEKKRSPVSQGMLTYVNKGELWIKDVPGGDAMRLTGGGILEPRISPSGEWLAYRKRDELWVIKKTGTDSFKVDSLRSSDRFAWSPAKDLLAYVAEDEKLCIYDADKMAGYKLGHFRHFNWSPDGRWLACELSAISIGRIQINGTAVKDIFTMGSSSKDGLVLADWPSDGKHIFFWRDPHFGLSSMADGVPLYVIPAGGGVSREIVSCALLRHDFYAYSPDRRFLAIAAGENRETWTRKRIALIEISTCNKSFLTDPGISAISPAWSPDGKRIAFVAGPDIGSVGDGEKAMAGVNLRRIWIMNRDGSVKHRLTGESHCREERPLWSSDGHLVLFVRVDGRGLARLCLAGGERNGPTAVIAELGETASVSGYYGYMDWDQYFNWWRGTGLQKAQ